MERARITVFDTTLRDGEQSPGCSMNVQEKLRLAHQLDRLGVDVIEAGFPIASEGDFAAVQAVAATSSTADHCRSGAGVQPGHRAGMAGSEGRGSPAHSRISRDLRHPSSVQAENFPRSSVSNRRANRYVWPSHSARTWSFLPRTPPAPTTNFCFRCWKPWWKPGRRR